MHHKRKSPRRKLVTRLDGRVAGCGLDARMVPPRLEERRARASEREQRADQPLIARSGFMDLVERGAGVTPRLRRLFEDAS